VGPDTPGFAASANRDYTRPAFGSVQVGEGLYYWIAFRRLSDWLGDGEPLDSGFITNEMQAHDKARSAVRLFLREREALPPLPESFVAAYHQRLKDRELMQELVARYMNVLEREDETVANGYDELELECGDFAPVDLDEGALDLDADEAAAA
jgi:hypothetical protein